MSTTNNPTQPDADTAKTIRDVINILDNGGITQAISELPEKRITREGVAFQTIYDSVFDLITHHIVDAHIQLDLIDYLEQVFRGD